MPSLPKTFLAAGLLSLSASAMAQPPGPPPTSGPGGPGSFGRAPMNLPVTRTEMQARLNQVFDRLDANHDGTLSPADRTAMRTNMMTKMFDRLDTNHDGSISKEEFMAAHEMKPGMRGDQAGWSKQDKRRDMRKTGMHHMKHGMDFPGLRMMLDQSNGPVTKAEFVKRGLDMFDKVDTNHDGKISPAERDAARNAMRNRRGGPAMPPPPPQGQ